MVLVVVLVANVVGESNWAVVCCLFLGYAMFVKKKDLRLLPPVSVKPVQNWDQA